jgi:HK97 family phage major capsid protein
MPKFSELLTIANRKIEAEAASKCGSILAAQAKPSQQEAKRRVISGSHELARGRAINDSVIAAGLAAANTGRRRVPPEVTSRIERLSSPLDNRGGFPSFASFLGAVAIGSQDARRVDERLIANAPTTYGTEGSGPDGGFSVPPDYRREIWSTVEAESPFLKLTDRMTSASNTLVLPYDATAPWSTAGVQATWVGEGQQITESKPVLGAQSVTLHKLAVLVSVTEELAQDSPNLERFIRKAAPAKIAYEIDRAMIWGTGAGQPLGIMNSPCLVTQLEAGGTGQTADTLVLENVVDMYSRMYGPSKTNAVWLYNQDLEPALFQLTLGNQAVLMNPRGGLADSPYGTILGRPAIPTQLCETLGDKGDILFVDWSQYLTVSRAIRQDVSMHLYFDYDVACFRFVLRIAGQPKWSTPLTSRDGSNTQSPFVVLDERT